MRPATLAHVFSCEFCKISKNKFFTEYFRVAPSEIVMKQWVIQRAHKIVTLH